MTKEDIRRSASKSHHKVKRHQRMVDNNNPQRGDSMLLHVIKASRNDLHGDPGGAKVKPALQPVERIRPNITAFGARGDSRLFVCLELAKDLDCAHDSVDVGKWVF